MQELLEILDLPYTGPGRRRLRALHGQGRGQARDARARASRRPDWAAFNATAFRELGAADTLEEIEERLGFPLVVKPASQGSSLGVEFAAARDEVPGPWWRPSATTTGCCSSATSRAASSPSACSTARPCRSVEAIPREEDFFNFEARYEIGRTDYVCPAELGGERDAVACRSSRRAPTRPSAAAASREST